MMDNLGTIARSGSKQFMEQLESESKASGELSENMIGQFGVGFYSAFIVGDSVEVVSRRAGQTGYKWTSDGSGVYDIEQVDDNQLDRGTKITIHLKPDM